MKKGLMLVIVILALAIPCYGRSKKSQAKIDARHAQAEAQANLYNARAGQIRVETRGLQQRQIQQQHERGIRNGNQYRKAKAAKRRRFTGF